MSARTARPRSIIDPALTDAFPARRLTAVEIALRDGRALAAGPLEAAGEPGEPTTGREVVAAKVAAHVDPERDLAPSLPRDAGRRDARGAARAPLRPRRVARPCLSSSSTTSRCAYEQSGAGPDVLWLAAGDNPGSNWRRYQTPAFEPGYRNTTYDARGAGATVSQTEPPWDIPVHAADAAALIEAVCDGPAFLVGLSMGSLIAVQLAHDRPDLVRGAVVMGTCVRKTGFIREWEEAEIALRRDGGELPPAFATAHYAMQYYPAYALGDDEVWERIKPFVEGDFAARDGAMLAAQWQACLDFDSTDLLPRRSRVPVHAVAFSEDVQTPPRRVREVAELARGRALPPARWGSGTARRSATGPTTSTTACARSSTAYAERRTSQAKTKSSPRSPSSSTAASRWSPSRRRSTGEIDCRADVGPDEAGDVVAIVTGTPPVGAAEVAPYPEPAARPDVHDRHRPSGRRGAARPRARRGQHADVLHAGGRRARAGLRRSPGCAACRASTPPSAPGRGTTRRPACRCASPTRRSASSAWGASAARSATLAAAVGMTVVAHDPYADRRCACPCSRSTTCSRAATSSRSTPRAAAGVLLGPRRSSPA